MIDKICEHVINAGSEMSECTCFKDAWCGCQEPDYNPDGTINVVTCTKYLPKETEVQEDDER
jgi:hypothetical protein